MLWKTLGCAVLFAGAVSLVTAAESEAPAKKKCPSTGGACADAKVTDEAHPTAHETAAAPTERGCTKCTKTVVAAEKACKDCDKSKVAAEKPCRGADKSKVVAEKQCKGCDKTKVAAETACPCSGKTKVAAEKACKSCDKTKVAADKGCQGCDKTKVAAEKGCQGCNKSKVVAAKACKSCDKSKGAAVAAGTCGETCDSVVVAERPCCPCEAALASVEHACEGCADTLATLERACRMGAALCAGETEACTECVGACCDESCTECVEGTVVIEERPACVTGLWRKCPAPAQPPAPRSPVTVEGAELTNMHALLEQKIAERDELQREIAELCAATETWQQVLVRVKVLEVNLTKMRKLGIDFSQAEGVMTNFPRGAVTPAAALESCTNCPETTAAYSTCESAPCGTSAWRKTTSFWDMLLDNNLARVLAEPTIVTVSGRPASFHVGGELPIPAGKNAAIACDFVRFGTQLDVMATTLGDNRVRLEIRPRISEIRDDRSMVVDGHKIPALDVTECDSACEMKFGETAALSGLVQRRVVASVVSSKTESRVREEVEEVMLMVVVTPEDATVSVPRTAAGRRTQR
jgi:hypothetical protein